MKTDDPLYYFVFQKKTVFMPLRYIYPECFHLIEDSPKLTPMLCLDSPHCHKSANCMQNFAKRVHYLFEEAFEPCVELIVAYFRHETRPGSIQAVLITEDFDIRKIICNKTAFNKFQREGETYKLIPPKDYWLINTRFPDIVPAVDLVRG